MAIGTKKQIILLLLLSYPLSSLTVQIVPRDLAIASVAIIAGIGGTAVWAQHYHPAALARQKFELEQAELKKKEVFEKTELEKKHRLELQKSLATNLLLQMNNSYSMELENIRKGKLSDKDFLLTIIRQQCGMRDMPLNSYYTFLCQNLESLKNTQLLLPKEQEAERIILINALEQIAKIYNLHISDKAKLEKEENLARKRKEEADQLKIQKEQLELKKLNLEIEEIKTTKRETKQELALLNQHITTLANGLEKSSKNQHDRAIEIMTSLAAIQSTQEKNNKDTLIMINSCYEALCSRFATQFQLFEQANNYIKSLVAQLLSHQQPPQPSAPPL